jgi:hypothetical protein
MTSGCVALTIVVTSGRSRVLDFVSPAPKASGEGEGMSRRQAIETALAAWREAERRLASAVDGDRERLAHEVAIHRGAFQQLSADHMVERIDSLSEAEGRRAHSTPSTLPFHQAARDTQEIASDIWEAARESDEDTPQTAANQRTTPRPVRPG